MAPPPKRPAWTIVDGWIVSDADDYRLYLQQPPRPSVWRRSLAADARGWVTLLWWAVTVAVFGFAAVQRSVSGAIPGLVLLLLYLNMLRSVVASRRDSPLVQGTIERVASHPGSREWRSAQARLTLDGREQVALVVLDAQPAETLLQNGPLTVLVAHQTRSTHSEVVAIRAPDDPSFVPLAPERSRKPHTFHAPLILFLVLIVSMSFAELRRQRESEHLMAEHDMEERQLAELRAKAERESLPADRRAAVVGFMPHPPWTAFPEPPASMRWRMGPGEDYLDDWLRHWEVLNPDGRAAYLAQHPPPEAWKEWMEDRMQE